MPCWSQNRILNNLLPLDCAAIYPTALFFLQKYIKSGSEIKDLLVWSCTGAFFDLPFDKSHLFRSPTCFFYIQLTKQGSCKAATSQSGFIYVFVYLFTYYSNTNTFFWRYSLWTAVFVFFLPLVWKFLANFVRCFLLILNRACILGQLLNETVPQQQGLVK